MVSDYDQAIRERVYIPNGLDADRDGVEDRSAIEIMRPTRVRPGDEGPGDRRAEPVLHVGLRAVRRRVHRRPRRRRRQRPLAALVRQLLRPARLRGDPGRDGRHRELDRLRHQRRPGGRAEHEGRDRLAQRAPARLPLRDRHRRSDARLLAHRQGGDDRPLLQRHAAQRGRGHGRRRADDDRPDRRDLLLVRLLADGRDHRLDRRTTRPSCRTSSPTSRGARSARPCATR